MPLPFDLTEMQQRKFKAAYESFITRQERLLEKELEKLNDGEILHKQGDKIWAGMSEERHDAKWHKAVRKVLLAIIGGTHRFWRQYVAQFLSKEPSVLFDFYSTMTAIYLGPKERRSAEAKKIIPRIKKVSIWVLKAYVMHNQKSVDVFKNGNLLFVYYIFSFYN
jgi:hypothetical protein